MVADHQKKEGCNFLVPNMSKNNNYSVYSRFVKPSNFEKVDLGLNSSRFVIYPMERGYGVTVGNAIRRILMSSIRGTCVAAMKFEGVKHEFSPIDGILEDSIGIGCNLRNLVLKMDDCDEVHISCSIKGPKKVYAKDVNFPDSIKVLNLDEYLFTITSGITVNFDLKISAGFGCEFSQNNKNVGEIGWIELNKYYTPVTNVSFEVGSARHNEYINYDKLTIDVKTNGALSPADAVGIAAALMREMLKPLISIDETLLALNMPSGHIPQLNVSSVPNFPVTEPIDKPVDHVEFSVRTTNCLRKMSITHLSELAQKSPMQLLSMKNFGRKSLNEVLQKLSENGFKLAED